MTFSQIEQDLFSKSIEPKLYDFCKKIKGFLDDKDLPLDLFDSDQLSTPKLTASDPAIHRAIVKNILNEHKDVMSYSNFGALLFRWYGAAEFKNFKQLFQKLNLALSAMYGRTTPTIDPITQDLLDHLLYEHLLKMNSSKLFNRNDKLTEVIIQFANHFKNKMDMKLLGANSVQLNIEDYYLEVINKDYGQYAQERSTLMTELDTLKKQNQDMGEKYTAVMKVISERLVPQSPTQIQPQHDAKENVTDCRPK